MIVGSFPNASETFIVSKFCGLLKRGLDVHLVCQRLDTKSVEMFPVLDEQALSRVHAILPSEPGRAVLRGAVSAMEGAIAGRASFRTYCVARRRHPRLSALKRWYLDHAIAKLEPKVIHFEFGSMARSRIYLKQALHAKLIVSFRGFDLNYVGLGSPNHYLETFQAADCIHVLGEDLKNRALRRGCPRDRPIVAISPGVDAQMFEAPGPRVSAGTLRILSIGRLHWKKGHEYAIHAVRRLADRGVDCTLRVVGEGDYRVPLEFAAWQLGVSRKVHFLGKQSHGKVRDELARADVLLHLAVSEGFCNAVMEAQAMELPVVCSDADGLSENVAHGVTGFVVPRRSVDSAAEALQMLASNPEQRVALGRQGRQRVLERFSIDSKLDQFEHMYRSVLS